MLDILLCICYIVTMVSFFGCFKMKNYGVGVSRIETITHQKIRIETIKPNSNN